MENQSDGEFYQALAEAAKSFDGKVWAQAFLHVIQGTSLDAIDEDLMTAWFSNAIMAGYDAGVQSAKKEQV